MISLDEVNNKVTKLTEAFKMNHSEYMIEYSYGDVTEESDAEDFLTAFDKFDLDTDDCTAEAYDAGVIAGLKMAKSMIERENAKNPILYSLCKEDILSVAESKEIDADKITDKVVESVVAGWSEGLNWWECTYDALELALGED